MKRFRCVMFLWRMMICDGVSVYWRIHCTIFKWVSLRFGSTRMTTQCFVRTPKGHGPGGWSKLWGVNGEPWFDGIQLPFCMTKDDSWCQWSLFNFSALHLLGSLMPLASFSHRNKHLRWFYLDMWNIIFLFSSSNFLLNLCFCGSYLRPIDEIQLYLGILNFRGWGFFYNVGLQTRKF